MTTVVRILWLTAIWLALWSDLSVANLLSGLVVAGAVVITFGPWRPGQVIVRPIHALKFFGYFLYQLAVSTLSVARTVITPRDRINTGIVSVRLLGCSDALATLIGDAISLTPGTLTLEVQRDPLTLYVHALDVRDIDVLRQEIHTLEILAIRAFGNDEAIAGLAADEPGLRRFR